MASPHVYTVYIYTVNIYIYICYKCIYNTILWPHHLTQLRFTHTWKFVWNIIFQAVLQPSPRRNCNCVDGQLSKFHTHCMKMIINLVSMHNLGFRLLGFHHWVQWRGAKKVSKECWGPCHGLIPSSWDFAQNYSPQIERRDQKWRGTFYWLDSEKAIELCISAVTDCLSWSTFHWVVALVVQVCAEICPVCQLGRHSFSPAPPDMT